MPDDWTTLESFDLSVIGSVAKPTWTGKAAETKTLIPFVASLLRAKQDLFIGPEVRYLASAGESLVRWIELVAAHPDTPSIPQAPFQFYLNVFVKTNYES